MLLLLAVVVQAPDAWLGQGLFLEHDLGHHHTPWRAWAAELWASGQVPLWCDSVGCGFPLMADGQTGVLYPVNIALGWVFSPWHAVTASLLLHQLWAAGGAYWAARGQGRSPEAALVAGLVFALGGFFVARFTYAGMQAVLAWLPWLLGLALRLGKGESLFAPFGLVVACVLTAGHPQMAVISLFGAAAVFVAQRPWRLHALLGGGLGLVAGLPQLLASAELSTLSARAGGVGSGFANVGSLPPWELSGLALPRYWGFERPADIPFAYMHKGAAYVGVGESHWEMCLFVGVTGLVLMAGARSRGWWALFAAGLVFAMGKYLPFWWAAQHLPVLDHFRFPVRFAALSMAAAAMLAAEGYDRSPRVRPVGAALAVLFLCAAAVGLLGEGRSARLDAVAEAMRWNVSWGLVFPLLILLACRVLPRPLMPVLLALELSLGLWQYNPRSPIPEEPPGLPEGLERVALVDRVQPPDERYTMAMMWGASDVLVPSPLLLPYHEAVLADAGLDIGREHGPQRGQQVMEQLEQVRALGVSRLVSAHPLDLPQVAAGVYELAPGPRAWLEGGEVELVKHEPGLVILDARGSGMVVLADTWYPGWTAHVDGHQRVVERVRGSLRGVRIDGPSRIEMRYQPSWAWTLWPALAAWILLFVATVYTGWVRLLGRGGSASAGRS